MANYFDFDPTKGAANLAKHTVSFAEARSVFLDDRALDLFDEAHSEHEERWVRIGLSEQGRLLVVVYTVKDVGEDLYFRLISARCATRRETQAYVER